MLHKYSKPSTLNSHVNRTKAYIGQARIAAEAGAGDSVKAVA